MGAAMEMGRSCNAKYPAIQLVATMADLSIMSHQSRQEQWKSVRKFPVRMVVPTMMTEPQRVEKKSVVITRFPVTACFLQKS